MTRREIISRLRNSIKEVSADSQYSNRYLWNVFYTTSKKLLKEDAEKGRIYSQDSFWESICIEMEPVSSLLCNCMCIPYNCTVYRSKKQLPRFIESSSGFIYRFISTPDLSQEFTLVSPTLYKTKSKIKYNQDRYVFIFDNYLYSPDHTYPLLVITGLFEEDVSQFKCDNTDSEISSCGSKLNTQVSLPDYLIDAGIKMSLTEILPAVQKPQDNLPNNNETQKEIAP